MVNIKILSREWVKPSTPTPSHLRTHKMSIVDQVNTSYFPAILFYRIPPTDHTKKLNLVDGLKKSLSDTLSHYCPLAGKFKDSSHVDCNDNGVMFIEARVEDGQSLYEFLQKPEISDLNKFLPYTPYGHDDYKSLEAILGVQMNLFDCGSIAIGMCMFHMVADANSMANFLQSWAAIARGAHDQVIYPDCTSGPILFPPKDPFPDEILSISQNNKVESVMRRFVFDGKAIEILKSKAASASVPNPTRVEALTAFLFKHSMLCHKQDNNGTLGTSILAHVVNLRNKVDPPLPNAFGNFFWLAIILFHDYLVENDHNDVLSLSRVVEILSEKFKSFKNEENVKMLQGEGIFLILQDLAPQMAKINTVTKTLFTSWCKLGFYDVDFGWGKPAWFGYCGAVTGRDRWITLLETKDNDGIEVWMLGSKQEMTLLENDQDFLAYASPNPSINLVTP